MVTTRRARARLGASLRNGNRIALGTGIATLVLVTLVVVGSRPVPPTEPAGPVVTLSTGLRLLYFHTQAEAVADTGDACIATGMQRHEMAYWTRRQLIATDGRSMPVENALCYLSRPLAPNQSADMIVRFVADADGNYRASWPATASHVAGPPADCFASVSSALPIVALDFIKSDHKSVCLSPNTEAPVDFGPAQRIYIPARVFARRDRSR